VPFSQLSLDPLDGLALMLCIGTAIGLYVVLDAERAQDWAPAFLAWLVIGARSGLRLPLMVLLGLIAVISLDWLSFRLLRRVAHRPEKRVLEVRPPAP
jgi:hypothetical protein